MADDPCMAASYPSADTLFGNKAFTGREWDPEIGLYYYRARYYDPKAGVFLSEDPAKDGMNYYAYVGGNPVTRVDPMGLEFGDYWDISATTAYYDSVSVNSPWVGFARIGSFMLKTFGMADAQKAGTHAGQGNYKCAAAKGALSVFKGLSLAAPLLGRASLARPAGPALVGETRAFSTVSGNYWQSMGGANHVGTRWALHHWGITQRTAQSMGTTFNSNWNLLAIPRSVNSYMNGAASTMWAEHGIRAAVGGSLVGGAAVGGWAGTQECGCQ